MAGGGRRGSKGVPPARDLAAEAHEHADVRQTFLRIALLRLPLISVFVITINLFVQVRGDIGLAVAVAQNLTFGAIAVIVLLNLVLYILLGIMVAAMPLVWDPDFNFWTRVIGGVVLLLLATVLIYTASWLVLAALVVVFAVIGLIVRRNLRRPDEPITRDTLDRYLEPSLPPADTVLRSLWADGRAMLRVIRPPGPVLTPAEVELEPPAEPKPLDSVVDGWNERAGQIQEPRTKSLTRLAFAGTVGFVALFGTSVLTNPIQFAPLELVSISHSTPQPGYLLFNFGRAMFVPNPSGVVRFASATDVTSVQLCDSPSDWWSVSVIQILAPQPQSGVICD